MISLTTKREDYELHGQTIVPDVVEPELLSRVTMHMDAVIDGRYETGVAPNRFWQVGDDPDRIVKIDQPHLSDDTILEFVRHSGIGRAAAEVTGANMIQVWVVQLLRRPVTPSLGNIGWHQDDFYWNQYWDGEVFTAWCAVGDITTDSGPLTYISGSHKWGLLEGSDFFSSDVDAVKANLAMPEGAEWVERPARIDAGSVSFHHKRTLHGAAGNHSTKPQRSFALHLRTEKSTPRSGAAKTFGFDLTDTDRFPILFWR